MFQWPLLVLFVAFIKLTSQTFVQTSPWTTEKRAGYRQSVKDLWWHGYGAYMEMGFPVDELMPLSCWGRGPDWGDPTNIGTNDVAGNYSLTLVDVLDTLAIMGEHNEFEAAVKKVIDWVQFDVDTKPQVFEVNIRVLGGLLSAHILATDETLGHKLDWYDDELLMLAWDLGRRLLPAFDTPTGLPFARINLRHGVPINETTETCVAGAGSLILEFATLSRLSGDDRFEKLAYKSFFSLWNKRSEIGLVGNNIDVVTGKWGGMETTGIGAGIDSFYEYALKWYVLSGEPEFLDVWNEAYTSVMRYARAMDGYSYRTVTMQKGLVASVNVDSLSAFWAGLQVLAGDIQNAIKSHLFYWNLWRKYHSIPELFDTASHTPIVPVYPLRPEFAESTYFLYQATKDPFYLDVGAQILHDLLRAKVPCGLATIANVVEHQLDDRMESFVLSETLKYLYLLFDEDNPLASRDSNFVFSTEGHLLILKGDQLRPMSKSRRLSKKYENLTCPAEYASAKASTPPLARGVRTRSDYEYARTLVGLRADSEAALSDSAWWRADGICEVPTIEIFSYEFLISRVGVDAKEDDDLASLKRKLIPTEGGVLVNEVVGLRVSVRNRFDGRGYDITRIGHLNVRQGETVYINDSLLFGPDEHARSEVQQSRARTVPLKFYTIIPQTPLFHTDSSEAASEDVVITSEFVVEASTADFGLDLDVLRKASHNATEATSFGVVGAHLIRFPDNVFGCAPFTDATGRAKGALIYVQRGDCMFIEKLAYARQAGALGVIVWHDGEARLNPSAEPEDLQQHGTDVESAVIAVIPASAAGFVASRLYLEEQQPEKTVVMVKVEKEWPEQLLGEDPSLRLEPTKTKRTKGRLLYINGYPMVNTELLF